MPLTPSTVWQRVHASVKTSLPASTSLFELIGTIDGGPLSWKLWGDLPSAGDTAYAGAVPSSGSRWLVSYYSGEVSEDLGWLPGMLGQSYIWLGELDRDGMGFHAIGEVQIHLTLFRRI